MKEGGLINRDDENSTAGSARKRAGIALREMAAEGGDESQKAPCQRVVDFLADRESGDLPRVSYVPGVVSVRLSTVLPERVNAALQNGVQLFGEQMPDFLIPEAVLVGVESRTSSPVRIPRDPQRLHHPQLEELFPCGEGAGFAGGIVSAAMDGQRIARAVGEFVKAAR